MPDARQKPKALERPLTLLKKSFELYRARIFTFIPLGLIAFFAGIIQLFSIQLHSILFFAVSVLASIVVSYIMYIAMIRVAADPVGPSFSEALAKVENYLLPAAWVSAMIILLVMGASVFLIIPGIIVAIYVVFSLFAVVVDHHQKNDAILSSWSLVNGRWFQVFGRMLVANLVLGIISWVLIGILWSVGLGETPFQTIARAQMGDHSVSVSQSVIEQLIANLFSIPLTFSFLAVFYENLKHSPARALTDKDIKRIKNMMYGFAIVGLVFFVTGIFFSSLRLAQIVPQLIKVTHAPAAVFSAF